MQANPQIGENAVALFRAHAIDGDLRNFAGIPWDQDRGEMVRVMVTATELFVIAHELAHCFQGEGTAFKPLSGTENVKKVSWQREFWADFYGLELAIVTGLRQGWQRAIVASAILSFFHGLNLMDESVAVLEKSDRDLTTGNETHPSHATRMDFILGGAAPVLLDTEDAQIAEALAQQEGSPISDIAATVAAGIHADAAAGKRAHPLWRAQDA